MAAVVIGEHRFGQRFLEVHAEARFGQTDAFRQLFLTMGGLVLADAPGGRHELRDLVDPSRRDAVDALSPSDASILHFRFPAMGLDGTHDLHVETARIRDETGHCAARSSRGGRRCR